MLPWTKGQVARQIGAPRSSTTVRYSGSYVRRRVRFAVHVILSQRSRIQCSGTCMTMPPAAWSLIPLTPTGGFRGPACRLEASAKLPRYCTAAFSGRVQLC